MPMSKILVFNRGEIACRTIRTAKSLGYATVAVRAEDEHDPLHAQLSDQTVVIGHGRAAYLSVDAAIDAARRTGADALHPGYGFLSESPELARACAAAGIVFIGPPAEAVEAMGDKAAARRLMERAGVPCVPGYDGADQDDARLHEEAARIGFPLMVKAAAGGGGKGLRRVDNVEQLGDALRAARSEALSAFGSGLLILERALANVRHVEVQIFADQHGNIVHLGERDCSVQRRHQKVIEESPSPAVDTAMREALGCAAVTAAAAVSYHGAGTVEFLLTPDNAFYFLEMNTRLQVEHPVTEAITGLDLVAWQILVAAGKCLPLGQAEIRMHGCAIEARLYAETSDLAFLPSTGTVDALVLPEGDGIRVDHGLKRGTVVSAQYDPMLAKIIAHGADRDEALRRLSRALEGTFLGGMETNRAFVVRVLGNPEFAAGRFDTGFIETHKESLAPADVANSDFALASLLMDFSVSNDDLPMPLRSHRRLETGGAQRSVVTSAHGDGLWRMEFDQGPTHDLAVRAVNGHEVRYVLDGIEASAFFCQGEAGLHIALPGRDLQFRTACDGAGTDEAAAWQARAPMGGTVIVLQVQPGDLLAEGDPIAVVEAMKMEHEVRAHRAGRVASVMVALDGNVAKDDVLVEIEPVDGEVGSA